MLSSQVFGILTLQELIKTEIHFENCAKRIVFRTWRYMPKSSSMFYRCKWNSENKNSNFDERRNYKLQLLPKNHSVVKKLILTWPLNLNHAGVQILMNNLKENFWIFKLRKTIRKVIKNCIYCKRFDARPKPVIETLLPINGIKEAAVFEVLCFFEEVRKYG